ncbi:MAG TPA: hfsB [Caulobacteraceae bacterium]|jgi:Mrp family chromosome partitioning ATPase|nr:hfsB [Caulobacteraceae bacterium]
MVDLTAEMAGLLTALGPAPEGRARVVQFVSARKGEGASTVARAYARLAAAHARRPVWLVDADLETQGQMAAVGAHPELFGQLGKASGASPDGSAFFTIQPPNRTAQGRVTPDHVMFLARPALGKRLWVTRLRRDSMSYDQRAHVIPSPDYWRALARHAEQIVIDTPSVDRSEAALTLAPYADDSVIVLAAEETDAALAGKLRDALEQAGGRVAGLVLNRMRAVSAPQRGRAA